LKSDHRLQSDETAVLVRETGYKERRVGTSDANYTSTISITIIYSISPLIYKLQIVYRVHSTVRQQSEQDSIGYHAELCPEPGHKHAPESHTRSTE